ncbi:MAG: hypothetical protein MUC99_02850 [Anaerolineae bacterium]|nr:hypothetical protein [Anaerolineae bacterium]
MKKALLLVGFWLLVTPLLLEGLMRLAVPALPPYLQLAAQRVVAGESLDINRIGLMTMDIDHNFMMKTDITDALYGPAPGVAFRVSTVQVQGSRMGFRSRPFALGDPIGAMVVGDSFSFCFTEYDDCWVTQFDRATGLPTLNTAQGSTGSTSHWRFIDTFGRTFKPPLVIWQFWVNDFNEDYQLAVLRGELPESSVQTVVPDYPDEGGAVVQWLRAHSVAWVVIEVALGNESPYISDFEKYHFTRPHSVTFNGHTLNFGQRYEQIATNLRDPRISTGVPLTRRALRDAQATVTGWGGQMVVIILPTREEVYRDLTAPLMGAEAVDALGAPRRVMNALCQLEALTCLDLLPIFREYAAKGDALYYADDMHLNPTGNAVLAAEVERWLRQIGVLSPTRQN